MVILSTMEMEMEIDYQVMTVELDASERAVLIQLINKKLDRLASRKEPSIEDAFAVKCLREVVVKLR